MSSTDDRSRHVGEAFRRWPFAFGIQFFFTLLGVKAVLDGIGLFGAPIERSADFARSLFVAGVTAVVFVLFMRGRLGGPRDGQRAA